MRKLVPLLAVVVSLVPALAAEGCGGSEASRVEEEESTPAEAARRGRGGARVLDTALDVVSRRRR